jgi:hypothetical protein
MESELRLGLIVTLGALALPASSAAATTYHPADEARIFADSAGGWEASSSSEGFCVTSLTCPTVTSGYQASGGTRGATDGFLRTAIENTVAADSITRAVWTSPSFTYRGDDGEVPDELTFEVARRADLSALLAQTGTSASFTAELVGAAGGVGRTIVDAAPLGSIEGWTRTRQFDVKPASLAIGREYRIRITSTFNTAARAFRESTVDYDDVRLRAVGDGSGNGNGNGGGGNGGGGTGAGGGNGAGSGNGAGGGNGGAVLRGNRLFLRLQCLGVAKQGRCKVRAVAYSKRGKKAARMTFPIERRVNARKGKKVTLRVRPRFVKELSSAKKVLVRSQLKAGDQRKTKFRRYKLTEAR